MLDFSLAELLIILVIIVFAIGPGDIPKVMQGLGRLVRRFQYMKFAMSQQFEELMGKHDLEELRQQVNFEAKEQEAGVDDDIDESEFDESEFDEAIEERASK